MYYTLLFPARSFRLSPSTRNSRTDLVSRRFHRQGKLNERKKEKRGKRAGGKLIGLNPSAREKELSIPGDEAHCERSRATFVFYLRRDGRVQLPSEINGEVNVNVGRQREIELILN